MKKVILAAVVAVIGIGIFCACIPKVDGYIRIHIRANSNSEYDQSVKYRVKDTVVQTITPLAESIESKAEMYETLSRNLGVIQTAVNEDLARQGISYRSTIRLSKEEFPTRTYEDITLESGIYDALIIELGTGTGDNWWCVAFPPLCFVGEKTDGKTVKYRSKIQELFFSKGK